MRRERLQHRESLVRGLAALLVSAVLIPATALASAEGTSTGSLVLSITAPATLPSGFTLNPGGTSPGNLVFPDPNNAGNGSITGMGSASCSPAGCTSPGPGTDLQYELTTDLTCIADPTGRYGGLEGSLALFGASNATGGSVTLDLRFTTSWAVSATVEDPQSEYAEASVDLSWQVPADFCIALTSCPTGSLDGGVAGNCPSGFLESPILVLGTSRVETSMGNGMNIGPMSTCDVTVVVLANASSGEDLSVTSSCLTASAPLIFTDGFESGNLSAWSSSTNL